MHAYSAIMSLTYHKAELQLEGAAGEGVAIQQGVKLVLLQVSGKPTCQEM